MGRVSNCLGENYSRGESVLCSPEVSGVTSFGMDASVAGGCISLSFSLDAGEARPSSLLQDS